jgi:hypothetical protein
VKTAGSSAEGLDRFIQVMAKVLGISKTKLEKIMFRGLTESHSRATNAGHRKVSLRRTTG